MWVLNKDASYSRKYRIDHQMHFAEGAEYPIKSSIDLTVTLKDGRTIEFNDSNRNPLHNNLQIPQPRTHQLDFIKGRLQDDYGAEHGFCADDILTVVGSGHFDDFKPDN